MVQQSVIHTFASNQWGHQEKGTAIVQRNQIMTISIAYGLRAAFLVLMSLVLLLSIVSGWTPALGFILFLSIISVALTVVIWLFRQQMLHLGVDRTGVTALLTNVALATSIISAMVPWVRLFVGK